MKYKFRFAECDREQYGDGWYELDLAALVDWDREGMTGLVERFEDEAEYRLPLGLAEGLLRGFHRPQRALAWWAVLLAGYDVPFDKFTPRLDLAEGQWVGGEGNRKGPQSRATPKKAGTAGRSAAKRSASSSRTTS